MLLGRRRRRGGPVRLTTPADVSLLRLDSRGPARRFSIRAAEAKPRYRLHISVRAGKVSISTSVAGVGVLGKGTTHQDNFSRLLHGGRTRERLLHYPDRPLLVLLCDLGSLFYGCVRDGHLDAIFFQYTSAESWRCERDVVTDGMGDHRMYVFDLEYDTG